MLRLEGIWVAKAPALLFSLSVYGL